MSVRKSDLRLKSVLIRQMSFFIYSTAIVTCLHSNLMVYFFDDYADLFDH